MARRDRDFFSSESQYRDETETFFFRVSMSRRDRDFFSSESQCRDETETFFSESQYRDETETLFLLRIDHFVVIQFEIDHIYS